MATLASNKQARFHYDLIDTLAAGIVLEGFEVKSLRKGNVSLRGAYIVYRENEAFLIGAYIAPYQTNNTPESYDPYRKRKLLLQKKELAYLAKQKRSAGLTVIPLSIYTTPRGMIKVDLALARGKKKHDKRQSIREREDNRTIARTLKNTRIS
ncbi:SsrA-binding protein SmpB [Candidatus Nomurabacteria bacterium]|nr:SsrA-binding protein SmpB [Candidatus Nomurabacteria bacterium]